MISLDEIAMYLRSFGYSKCIEEVIAIETALREEDPRQAFQDLFDDRCRSAVEEQISGFGSAVSVNEYESIRTVVYATIIVRAEETSAKGVERVRTIAEVLTREFGGSKHGFARVSACIAFTHCFEIAFPNNVP